MILRTKAMIRFAIVLLLGGFCTTSGFGQAGTVIPLSEGVQAKKFYASTVDGDNILWFLTEAGIVSFDGSKWEIHDKNRKVSPTGMKAIGYDFSSYGHELWFATPQGATVATLPVDARSGATTYYLENSKILSENVLALVIGKPELRWFGTDKGISAFQNKKWLENSYFRKYPEGIFTDYPITSMATSPNGDSLYAGTVGGGVIRVYKNDVDGISGASEYAEWGPIIMPSDNVYSVHVSADGTQWIGTDKGVARHKGGNTLEGWTVFSKAEGLADDFVQAITSDKSGKMYFGTKGGLSVYDGTSWTTYSTGNGLAGDNVLTLVIDRTGGVWAGTDNGVSCLKGGKITSYR
ncbi:MAG TPA: hypothetical protein VK213_12165 [Bacteroidales bacterium]|nr:hypothetical protein [Bacteroidales bacterium]